VTSYNGTGPGLIGLVGLGWGGKAEPIITQIPVGTMPKSLTGDLGIPVATGLSYQQEAALFAEVFAKLKPITEYNAVYPRRRRTDLYNSLVDTYMTIGTITPIN
jgi:hypothetical protein